MKAQRLVESILDAHPLTNVIRSVPLRVGAMSAEEDLIRYSFIRQYGGVEVQKFGCTKSILVSRWKREGGNPLRRSSRVLIIIEIPSRQSPLRELPREIMQEPDL
jgi:hypothetical protein